MKYRELVSSLSSTNLVVVSGDFNPPTNHHQMLIQGGKKIAESIKAPFVVYLRSGGLLSEAKQETYFKAAFPNTNFKRVNFPALQERESYDIYVVGETLQCCQLSESVEIDRVASAMNVEAASGNYYSFKSHLPIGMPDVSARRLLNDIREALGYPVLDFSPSKNLLRDSYVRGDKYKVGDLVESAGQTLTITRRGTNYLSCTDADGNKVSKWLHEVTAHDQG